MRISSSALVPALLMMLLGPKAFAASAVAFDSRKLIYEYAYGIRTEDEAKERALKGCVRRSGRKCRIIISCGNGGYGAVYTGRLRDHSTVIVGATCGAADPHEANVGAEQSCNTQLRSGKCVGPKAAWHDRAN
jgi:uncharacterized protein DUF4189